MADEIFVAVEGNGPYQIGPMIMSGWYYEQPSST